MRNKVKPGICSLSFWAAMSLGAVPGSTLAQVSVLHAFSAPANGANPMTGLASLNDVLCGTTVNEGPNDAGTLFYLSPSGAGFNTFHALAGSPDGAYPRGGAVVYGNCIYIATSGGGSNGTGAVLSDQTNGTSALLFHFDALHPDTATNETGAIPGAAAVVSGGTLYGTTTAGGRYANGVIYAVATNGSAASVLHHFTALDPGTGTNTDGAVSWGSLVLSGDTLYGTTSAGGAAGNGTVFSVRTNGSDFATLHSFPAMDSLTATNTDGAMPEAGLVLSSNATLFGTTTIGGAGNSGTLFSIGTNGAGFAVLHHFAPRDPATGANADGARPQAALTVSGNRLYGTTSAGGAGTSGVIFSVYTDGSRFKVHHHFSATNPGNGSNADGALPVGDLLRLGTGLYGTTFAGGSGSVGAVFRMSLLPAFILDAGVETNESTTIHFLGGPGSTNIVQAATDVTSQTNWLDVSTNVADDGGSWQFTETSNSPPTTRFYRSYAPD